MANKLHRWLTTDLSMEFIYEKRCVGQPQRRNFHLYRRA
ncbi:unnamed protein product [Arabidopsis lyrata]|uniref:Uncharacterized protein n=1 Tax=Arabidopsis suecica TaxID=45249 RepID=A0A8T2AG33_ARASU|nr:hypothetical protein ISN44_As09g010390 [Arabidopsis suecica]CAH8267268.1 unnamed protein product [Arabidopsis lyrata]